jgi:hypothetical protein
VPRPSSSRSSSHRRGRRGSLALWHRSPCFVNDRFDGFCSQYPFAWPGRCGRPHVDPARGPTEPGGNQPQTRTIDSFIIPAEPPQPQQ